MSDSIHVQIAEAVVERIKGLSLVQIENEVFVREFDADIAICLPGPPGIAVLPIGVEEVHDRQGENQVEEIGYPITVLISDVCVDEPEQIVDMDRRRLWRELVMQAMWHKPTELITAGAPSTIFEIGYRPGSIFSPLARAKRNLWVGTQQFRVWDWQQRTDS